MIRSENMVSNKKDCATIQILLHIWLNMLILLTVIEVSESMISIDEDERLLFNLTTTEINAPPPREFPEGNSTEYHIINNSTLRKNLSSLTEQEDMRNSGEYAKIENNNFGIISELDGIQRINSNISVTTETAPSLNIKNPKIQTEYIENGDNTEDIRRQEDLMATDVIRNNSHEPGGDIPMVQGQLAAILAGIFVMIAVVGYAVLLSWRRFLENRYGTREMLINEEDFIERNDNDMHHFSI